jgi:adenine-specific DNA-methyltransferase
VSKELLKRVIDKGVEGNLNVFFQDVSKYYRELDDDLSEHNSEKFTGFQAIGEINFSQQEKLLVVTADVEGDLTERSGKKAQYEKARRILKQYQRYDAGIFVFSDSNRNFRLSLVYGTPDAARLVWSNFRRFTYFASRDQTNNTFLGRVGGCDFSSLDIVKDAFSVEKVNKEFYKEIAKYYYRLTGKNDCKREMVLPSVADGDDRKYEEFAVRLIGRIIFCWFLKHKKSANGIPLIPREALSISAVHSHSDYYHGILEPLFFEVMNKHINERKTVSLPKADKIPFLNGGLFEPHGNDYYVNMPNYALKITDRWFEDFLSVLEQYNFTIDENSTVDADVSVDPEMLGRIFENLLAEVVPETGETARKATGSYYTPRVIVDYMVEQSLKQYLLTKTAIPDDKLNSLLSYEDNSIDLTDGDRDAVVTAFKEIKVIDPACGSGAFPMGILHRMLLVLEKVDPRLEIWRRLYLSSYHPVMRRIIEDKLRKGNEQYIRKLTIIQDSIYGIDIQPIAVEIAKLRCFLSLIVDELVLDNEDNRGIEPLPNLEFKFIAANTLIGLPPRAERQGIFGVSGTVQRLKALRESYLRSYGKEKEAIQGDFRDTQQGLFKENMEWARSNIQMKQLIEWDPFSYQPSGWFDPDWMFGIVDGFDVVIANPPYIDSELMVNLGQTHLREAIQRTYAMTRGNWDIYIAFFESGLKAMNTSGVLTFITPDKWISKPFGDALRIAKINNISTIIRSGRGVFESSNVDSIISFFSNIRCQQLKILDSELDRFILKRQIDKKSLKPPFALDYLFSDHLELLLKIDTISSKVSNVSNCENACATSDAYKLESLIKDSPDSFAPNKQLKIINTGTIGKYYPRWGNREMTYLGHKYLHPVVNKEKFFRLFKNTYSQKAVQTKIIIKGLNLLDACLDPDGTIIPGKSTLIIASSDIRELKFLLSIMNSKLAFFYLRERYPASSYNLGTSFTKEMINNLPLPLLKENERKPFVSLVDNILILMISPDYFENSEKQLKVKEYQSQIDQMVYELYGLTPEEIGVVEGTFKK